MTGDLLIIVPTRGRPHGMARLIGAVHSTRRLETHLHFAADDDDPALPEYRKVFRAALPGDEFEVGARTGLAGWTNRVAVRRAGEYRFLASFGDDMVPRTPGWDAALCRAIGETGGGTGFSYPHDGTREDIPEACVMSSDIVTALGWMCNPALGHWYVDNVWADLGRAIGCLRYLRAVAVDHVHPATGKAAVDATYSDAAKGVSADKAAYEKWRKERMAADVAAIRELQLVRQ